jgi:hypothetical protein
MKVRRGVQERVVVDRQAEVVHETTSISSWVFGLHQGVCYDVPGALRPVDVLQTLCSWCSCTKLIHLTLYAALLYIQSVPVVLHYWYF